jgi:hypothetical protein
MQGSEDIKKFKNRLRRIYSCPGFEAGGLLHHGSDGIVG